MKMKAISEASTSSTIIVEYLDGSLESMTASSDGHKRSDLPVGVILR